MRGTRPAVALALVVSALIAGCGEAPASGASSPQVFEVVLPAAGELDEDLPVVVHDPAGLLEGIGPSAWDEDTPEGTEVVSRDPARPDVLIASWLGGMCDRRVELELLPVGGQIQVTGRTERPSGCILAGLWRAVALDFRAPVDPAIVRFDQGP